MRRNVSRSSSAIIASLKQQLIEKDEHIEHLETKNALYWKRLRGTSLLDHPISPSRPAPSNSAPPNERRLEAQLSQAEAQLTEWQQRSSAAEDETRRLRAALDRARARLVQHKSNAGSQVQQLQMTACGMRRKRHKLSGLLRWRHNAKCCSHQTAEEKLARNCWQKNIARSFLWSWRQRCSISRLKGQVELLRAVGWL